MKAERWLQIEELYHRAQAWDADRRESLLKEACGTDSELYREVQSLLAAEQLPISLLDHPVDSVLPLTPLAPGTQIGSYRVEAQVGQGGMGVVYRAFDTRLNRVVAIKFLANELSDREARLRFQREARMVSSLNHPHILTVFDAGEFEGRQYLVTEFIDHGTLRDWARHPRRSWQEVLELLVGVADGLDAAHNAGILHRDIKPDNILVTRNGYAKLADFGLAKRIEGVPGNAAPSLPSHHTKSGVITGTLLYMSPEQASGKPVDERSDVFSFGIVLYEMLAGRPPFSGATLIEQVESLFHQAPAALPGDIPQNVRTVVAKALKKDPAERYPSMRKMVADLRGVLRQNSNTPASTNRRQLGAAASAALALLAIGAAWWVRGPANPAGHSQSAALKNLTFNQLTDQPGQELYPSLAPDGKSLVYASRASGNLDIYAQRIGGKNPVNLTRDSNADDTQPAFSPDGDRIAFRSERDGGGIFVMGASGENVKRITDFGYDPAWSPDGNEIVCASTLANPELRLSTQSQLFSVNIATGEKHPISPEKGIAMQPHWSPHGYRIAYWAQVEGRLDVLTIPATGGEAVPVTHDTAVDWNPVWSPDGSYLYFASNRGGSMNLWRAPIDERSGKVLGEIEAVTTPAPYAASISFSRSGRQLAYIQRTLTSNIYRVRFDPSRETTVGQPEPVTQGSRNASNPHVSPDGEWLVFNDVRKQDDLFVVRNDGSGLRQLTDDIYYHRWPAWSPDGQLVAIHSNRGGKFDIWTIRPDGGGLHQLTYTSGSITHPVWSPDGKQLIYSLMNGTPSVIEPDKPWSSQSPKTLPPLNESDTWYEAASWSSDGHRLAGFQLRNDGKFTGISVYSFDTGNYTRITDFGFAPSWLKDGRRVLFTSNPADGSMYLVDSVSRKMHPVLSVAPNQLPQAEISPDNRWIYFSLRVTEADVWLANLS
jgi:Tol biopolymer transport system component